MITLYVDGAARGNPGPAGIGIRVEENGKLLREESDYLGKATNNAAEYTALIRGLQLVRKIGASSVSVISDSELIVRQMNGVYKVKVVFEPAGHSGTSEFKSVGDPTFFLKIDGDRIEIVGHELQSAPNQKQAASLPERRLQPATTETVERTVL